MKSPESRDQQLLQIAFELQADHEAQQERKAYGEALAEAAVETGLEPRFLQEAEVELARREQVAALNAADRAKTKRLVSWILSGAAAVAGAVTVYVTTTQRALERPDPWHATFDASSVWALQKNPESRATLAFEDVPGRGRAAHVSVEAFGTGDNQKYFVNLDDFSVPNEVSGYRDVVVELKGSLPVARVYLEADGERWRSPAIDVHDDWTTHRLPLSAFDRQEKGSNGEWHTASFSAPSRVQRLSVKVGHFMNPLEATGSLYVAALRLEAP